MKKLLLFAVISALAACSNNAKTEAEEAHKRDSMDKAQVDQDAKLVEEMERKDDSTRKANEAMAKDSAHHDHEGHDHEGHDHSGHSH